jgi:ATP-dependent Clp protease adaptor protein ClpS
MAINFGKTETLVLEEIITETMELKKLLVFNDDVNTFDHVIETLVEICDHTYEQAEQCAWIIHTKGKYVVKNGSFTDLLPMRTGICDRGISAEIID